MNYWKAATIVLVITLLGLIYTGRIAAAQKQHKDRTGEILPSRPECGLFLPARDERRDLARLVRADQFLECERDGFPKNLAPPWKTADEGSKKLGDACEYFSGESAKNYPQVGQENLELAADRCRIEVIDIILSTLVPKK